MRAIVPGGDWRWTGEFVFAPAGFIDLLFYDTRGIPRQATFWAATVTFARAFCAGHLPAAATLGLRVNALVVVSHLVLNGIGGLAFWWLYCTFGLECATPAYFLSELIRYSLIPLVTVREAETARCWAAGILLSGVL